MGHSHIRRVPWLVLAAVALAAVGGAAFGAIPTGDDEITGCYKAAGGDLRVIDAEADQTCRSNEVPLSWNRTGPPGPPGGSFSFTNGYSEHVAVPPGQFRFVNAICPSGTTVIGGGYATENVSTALLVPTNSYPVGMGDGRGAWYVVMHNIGAQAETYWAISYCAHTS